MLGHFPASSVATRDDIFNPIRGIFFPAVFVVSDGISTPNTLWEALPRSFTSGQHCAMHITLVSTGIELVFVPWGACLVKEQLILVRVHVQTPPQTRRTEDRCL